MIMRMLLRHSCTLIFWIGGALLQTGNAQMIPLSNNQIDSMYEASFVSQQESAVYFLNQARNVIRRAESNGFDFGVIKGRILQGYAFYKGTKLDSAKLVLNECERYFVERHELQNSLDYGRTLLYLGMVTREMGDFAIARLYANKCRDIFSQLNNERYLCDSFVLIGHIELSLEDYGGALKYFLEASKIYQSANVPGGTIASNALSIANVYTRMAQFDRAIPFAKLAVHIIDSLGGSTSVRINAFNQMGNIYSNKRDLDSALFWYRKVADEANEAANSLMSFIAEYNIANVNSNFGNYQLSNKILRTLLSSTGEVPAGMLENCDRLFAKNYLGLKNADSSILFGRKVFKNSTRVGAKQQLVLISEVLMNAYLEKGRLDSAFYFQRLHYASKDSLFNKENQRKFAKVFAELETIEKQFEIERLQSEQEMETVKRRDLQYIIVAILFSAIMVIASLALLLRYRQKKQQLATTQLRHQLEQKERDLHQQALRMIHINNRLSEVEESLKKMKEESPNSSVDLQQLIGTIHMSKALEKEWENFNSYFSSVHEGFIEQVERKFPLLSVSERRLVVLVRMNLTNKEVASILNIEVGSVKMAKYRLKRKLGLTDEQDMYLFLQNLEAEVNQSKA